MSGWNLLAKFLAQPLVVKAIIRFATDRPYAHIRDLDGAMYMGRWWVLKESRWFPWAARLHYIAREDRDRDLHDHPYDYRTFILRGGYDERTLDTFQTWKAGETVARRAQHFHKIDLVQPQTWTLFLYRHRRKSNPWGFLTLQLDGSGVRKVGWRKYLGLENEHLWYETQVDPDRLIP